MTSRVKKLGRLVELMKLQLRLSEWQFAELHRQQQTLQDEQVYLIEALNGAELPTGSSNESIARRLTNTSVGVQTAQMEASRQLDQVQRESRRIKQLEQTVRAVLADKFRDAERRSLQEMSGVHPGTGIFTPDSRTRA
jgi:hypothetical protein